MTGREREVRREDRGERADHERSVDEDQERGQREAGDEARRRDRARDRWTRHRRRAPRDRHEGAAAVEPDLRDVQAEGKEQQDRAHGGGAGEVAEARDEAVRLRRKDREDASDDLWVAEILEDVDRGGQDRRAETGARERQRDRPEHAPGPCPEIPGRLLHPRVTPREDVGNELIGEREVRDRLHPPDPEEPEDDRRLPEDAVGDDPARPEQQQVRERDDEGRREQRQDADDPEERLPGHVRVHHRVRVDEAEGDRGRRR